MPQPFFDMRMFFDMRGLDEVIKALRRRDPIVRSMFTQWGARYLGFIRRRFVRHSRGGGDWKPLAESTKRARRGPKRRLKKGRKKGAKTTTRGSGRKFAILRDTSTLFGALTIGAPGNLFEPIDDGIRVGFGGPSRHSGGKATIRDIAIAHDEGTKTVPARPILVEPDKTTTNALKRISTEAVKRLLAKHEI